MPNRVQQVLAGVVAGSCALAGVGFSSRALGAELLLGQPSACAIGEELAFRAERALGQPLAEAGAARCTVHRRPRSGLALGPAPDREPRAAGARALLPRRHLRGADRHAGAGGGAGPGRCGRREPGWRSRQLGACAGAELGWISGSGVGVDAPNRRGALWSAARGDLAGRYDLAPSGLGLELTLSGLLPLERHEFRVVDESVFRPAPVVARVSLGLALELD